MMPSIEVKQEPGSMHLRSGETQIEDMMEMEMEGIDRVSGRERERETGRTEEEREEVSALSL